MIMILGDLHLGKNQDDSWVQHIQLDAINQAIQLSKERNITTWIQLGDIFDVRKHTSTKCLEFLKHIMSLIEANGIHMHTIVGNHDMFYKEQIHPNTATELLSHYDFVTVHDKPTTVDINGVSFDMIPWLCNENKEAIFNHIKNSDAEYCVGHWELSGFYFYKNVKSHGIEPDFLKHYKQVWSGHFHTQSKSRNVHYLGTPYTLTAGDENDPRGVWIFDCNSRKLEFVQNEHTWHQKITYPSQKDIDINILKNKSVRCVVEQMDKDFTKFESKLESVVHDLRIISSIETAESADDEEVEVKNIIDLMTEYVEALDESDENKKQINSYVKALYVEATA